MVKAPKVEKMVKAAKYKVGATPSLLSWTRGTTWFQTLLHAIPFLLLPFAGNLIGYLFTGVSPARYSRASWQRNLKKPWFTPPDWVFGPVWTFLYAAMGLASFIVWRTAGGFNMHSQWPLILYGLSLLLNWIWPLLFFVKGKLLWSAIDITALWGVVAAAVAAFWRVHPLAGMLLLPYLAWLTLASIINWFIVKDNAEPNLPPGQKPYAGDDNTNNNNNNNNNALRQRSRLSGNNNSGEQQVVDSNTTNGSSSVYSRTPSSVKAQQQQQQQSSVSTTRAYQRPTAAGASGGSDNDVRED